MEVSFSEKFFGCFFEWDVVCASRRELESADVILTQAAGRLADKRPGKGNMILAHVLRRLHAVFPEKPMMPQEEVAWAAPDLPYYKVITAPGKDLPKGHSTRLWNTDVVVGAQAAECRKNGWTKAIYLTLPGHHWRTALCMKHYGLTPYGMRVPATDYSDPENIFFSLRHAYPFLFLVREFVCRILFLITGKI